MGDSPDIFGNDPLEDDAGPTSAELEAAGQSSMFGASGPAAVPLPAHPQPPAGAQTSAGAQPYRVLARKYRPQTFAQLIGQDAMVQTLANAIKRGRLAHAFLMTGVRGVGKTSTARLIAKALNCIGDDGQGGPTIDPCGRCEPCVAIAEGRHIDVIEMDAASHTGVDDVREIIEAVRYAAVSARYKIYIIDEVHMLSRNAFNALLKTLEEPPAHVKFLFATTEADKLPVTVLSRCQRFDLRRIATPMLAEHFARICQAENVAAEAEALEMIAAAAEGSVRDGLSILDQAIAHADMAGGAGDEESGVTAEQVRDMLGLADKTMQRRTFAALLAGEDHALLELIAQQFALGIEPIALMRAAMELTHRITVAQIGQKSGEGFADAASAEEREAIEGWARELTAGQLHRLWQLLLKGHDEVRTAPDPLIAAQMALLRVMHAADMPDPGTLVRKLEDMAASPRHGATSEQAGIAQPAPAEPSALPWQALVERIEHSGQLRAAQIMHDWIRPVTVKSGVLAYALVPGYSGDPGPDLREALFNATGERWTVERLEGEGEPSLREQADARRAAAQAELRRSPLVAAVLEAFPGAEFVAEEEHTGSAGNRNWSQRA
jgi:DNA polymerase-3 subunit gamma/tau